MSFYLSPHSGHKCLALDDDLMEAPCSDCAGRGEVPKEFVGSHGHKFTMNVDCPECVGVGMIPTPAGRRLLDFVTRHVAINRSWNYLRVKNVEPVQQVEITDADVRTDAEDQGR